MINPKTQERELAYVAKIGWVRPIEGADNIELVGVNGWSCIAKRGEFHEGDLAVYFEIDSKLPERDWSEFMAAKHYKVKTMKLSKFKVVSQGLALPAEAFGWELTDSGQFAGGETIIKTNDKNNTYFVEGDFVTEYLGVKYSVEEDNVRKAPSVDKYKKMASRHPKLFQNKIVRWIYKRDWGKKVLFLFFGKKRDKKGGFPSWVVKTDEERAQNMPWVLESKEEWYATEKIDGSSTTFTMKGRGRKRQYLVCSRNVAFDTPEKVAKCFYDSNIYLEMAQKYEMDKVLAHILDENKELEFVTIQGETFGAGVQKRDYGLKGHDLMVFNLIFGYKNGERKRFNPREMTDFLKPYGVPCVPIVDEQFVLPDTIEELLAIATDKSAVDGGMREGLVFRSKDGAKSFKAVSNEFLLKYHNG